MSEHTKIQWADHTFNPWIGCTKISPGCAHCYAEARDKRHLIEPVDHWGKNVPRLRTSAANWKLPVKWNRERETLIAQRRYRGDFTTIMARRARVFCASLADWLDDEVPVEWLADLLQLIHDTPHLDWLLLTKRPENWNCRILAACNSAAVGVNHGAAALCHRWLCGRAPANVWLGISVEDQRHADERIPLLLSIPAKVRFLSCEPLLGPVDLKRHTTFMDGLRPVPTGGIHWCIIGGESGHDARPCNLEWIASLVAQCQAAGVATFVKQLGAVPITDNANLYDWDTEPKLLAIKEGFAAAHIALKDKKGGDSAEFPDQLKFRQFPAC